MTPTFAPASAPAIPVHVIAEDDLADVLPTLAAPVRTWAAKTEFKGGLGQVEVVRSAEADILAVLAGYGTAASRARGRFHIAAIAAALPKGTYALHGPLSGNELNEAALGWLLAAYRFDRYKSGKRCAALLQAPKDADVARLEALAAGEVLTRDLINTPAADMGPDRFEDAFFDLATRFGARAEAIRGNDLLARNFPMIHAVGRTAGEVPRLLDFRWGSRGPALTLVGKGVCFDTGGLNLKPGAAMGSMKKDMGGGANVLGLAQMIMTLELPLRLRVLVPAVENAIGGRAFRPGDVLTSRKGLTVEVNNTDAEGRLVLADALALASEEAPDLIVSMATLTGAARVAVGPDLTPFYATDDGLAQALRNGGAKGADPVWQLPFWEPYEKMIEPQIADLDNAPSGGFAGSITAALFLRRFVAGDARYAHFDIYGWRPNGRPGLPKGGLMQGGRAILEALPAVLGL
ncbi:MAG: leucyl aminopeptidase family protein [Pseudomonadota bacterium]